MRGGMHTSCAQLPAQQHPNHAATHKPESFNAAGHKTEEQLQALGVSTAADLRALPRAQLVARFGERVGAQLHGACRGKVRCGWL